VKWIGQGRALANGVLFVYVCLFSIEVQYVVLIVEEGRRAAGLPFAENHKFIYFLDGGIYKLSQIIMGGCRVIKSFLNSVPTWENSISSEETHA